PPLQETAENARKTRPAKRPHRIKCPPFGATSSGYLRPIRGNPTCVAARIIYDHLEMTGQPYSEREQAAATGAAPAPSRVVIANVQPSVDGGHSPAKAIVGDRVPVEANIFLEGHDELSAVLLYRRIGAAGWSETPMRPLGNDAFSGGF